MKRTLAVSVQLVVSLLIPVGLSSVQAGDSPTPADTCISVLSSDLIHFNQACPDSGARPEVEVLDNGRVIRRDVNLPGFRQLHRITGKLTINPIPKDELVVHDKWDRAGSIAVVTRDGAAVELVRFITAYGGRTEWEVDLSDLAPILSGATCIEAFIDTWVSPAWIVEFELCYATSEQQPTRHWVVPLVYEQSFKHATHGDTGLTVTTNVPESDGRVLFRYLVTGHCTDGRGADEFVSKDNVISVDGVVVYRFRPWRDDCLQFRDINPYTRRWSDGWWSSDYDRSGWCPGDWVRPVELDLSDHLTPGEHDISIRIENTRPADADGHHGYWRVSACLVGESDPILTE